MVLVLTYVRSCIGRDFSRLVSALSEIDKYNGNVVIDVSILFAFSIEYGKRIGGLVFNTYPMRNVEVELQ